MNDFVVQATTSRYIYYHFSFEFLTIVWPFEIMLTKRLSLNYRKCFFICLSFLSRENISIMRNSPLTYVNIWSYNSFIERRNENISLWLSAQILEMYLYSFVTETTG
jgi:hypothetical protein